MCYFNGIKVTKEEKIRLKALEKYIQETDYFDKPLYLGPDYPKMPMIRRISGEQKTEIVTATWGFLPNYTATEDKAVEFRNNFITLNARVENLFLNESGNLSMYADAALHQRCLIPSTHFFEYRHIHQRGKNGKVLKSTVAYPYLIGLVEQELYYFAGIWNFNNLYGPTSSIVTCNANTITSQIHNLKKRMPVILPQNLAREWVFNEKLSKDDIYDIGSYQIESGKMRYYTVSKDFRTATDPMQPFHYPDLPPLGEDVMSSSQFDIF